MAPFGTPAEPGQGRGRGAALGRGGLGCWEEGGRFRRARALTARQGGHGRGRGPSTPKPTRLGHARGGHVAQGGRGGRVARLGGAAEVGCGRRGAAAPATCVEPTTLRRQQPPQRPGRVHVALVRKPLVMQDLLGARRAAGG